jgi:sec-independent protein translocase protein TatC
VAETDSKNLTDAEQKVASHDELVDTAEQPFLDHIIELRSRILKGLAVVVLLFLPIFYFANDLYAFVSAPLMTYLPEGATMIATEVASPFLTPLKLAILLAVFVGMPFLLYQIWAFVAPGLYLREKKFAVPLLVSSVMLFYLGTAFAYYAVFPLVFNFLTSLELTGVTMATDISAYLNFVTKMFFAFGIAFEIPVATLLLIMTGITSTRSLASKRPYIIVGCFVVGMLLTPPDVISQLLLAIPAWLLFEIGIVFGRLVERNREEVM